MDAAEKPHLDANYSCTFVFSFTIHIVVSEMPVEVYSVYTLALHSQKVSSVLIIIADPHNYTHFL